MNNLESKIKDNERFILIIVNNTFSSKYIIYKINSLDTINTPYEIVNFNDVIYFAKFISLIAIPAIIIFHNGKIEHIHRGICSLKELKDLMQG